MSPTLESLYCSSEATAVEGIGLQILLVRSFLATRLRVNQKGEYKCIKMGHNDLVRVY